MRIIGLDIGTTSLCGILLDTDSGAVVRSLTLPNDSAVPSAHPYEKLQDPAALIARIQTIAETLRQEGGAAAVGVTGQMHGIVYTDRDGQPVGPLAIWQDGRGDLPYRDGKTYAEYLSTATGYPLSTGYGAVTHFYNTVNGCIPAGAVTFCNIHDLAVMALTGRKTPCLTPSDAAGIGLYDLKAGRFDRDAVRAAGMDPSFFPEVAAGFALAGHTKDGIPTAAAIGDNQASVLGSVNDLAHSILVNVGTGSQISCVTDTLPETDVPDRRPLIDGHWLLAGSSLCGGRAYALLETFLRETAEQITGQAVDSAYPAMDRLMADYRPPAQPLVIDTRFCGTRREPTVRGSIRQIGIDNFTVAALCDGVMNGMAAELYDLYREMAPFLKETPTRLIGSGNGLRRNAPLAARFSAAFGLPLSIPVHREEAAFGAALFAAVAAGRAASLKEAQALIRYC